MDQAKRVRVYSIGGTVHLFNFFVEKFLALRGSETQDEKVLKQSISAKGAKCSRKLRFKGAYF